MSSDAAATSAGRCPRAVAGFLLLAVLVLAADLITKTLAFRHVADQPIALSAENGSADIIPPHKAVVLVPKLLSLKLTLNRGAAFGLGQGGRWVFVLVAVAAVALVAGIFWRSRRGDRLLHVALALLLAGALGNLVDRLLFGVVRDMCWLFPGVRLPFGWHWPGGSDELYPWIFNVADAAMCVALGLMLLLMYRSHRQETQAKPPV